MRLFRLVLAVTVAVATLTVVPVRVPDAAAAVPAGFTDTVVAPLSYALDLAFRPDRSMLVATKSGVVRTVRNGALQTTPALDLSTRACSNNERGLLGIATDPASTTYLWAFYTARDAGGTCAVAAAGSPNPASAPRNRVSRFTFRSDGTLDPASELVLLDGIYSTSGYHNAGDIDLGKDGNLYIATGDGQCDYLGGPANPGGSGCNGVNDTARDRNVLNAKILRITKDGGIPTDNPFTGAGTARCNRAPAPAGTVCQETYAWGLRNPFRLAFDPNATGTSFRINDVGQDVWDEIDQGTRGADYGWNVREGHCAQTGPGTPCSGLPTPGQYTDPVYDYNQDAGCASITGGAYVPNGVWPAQYTGAYLFADYVCGKIFALSAGNVRTELATDMGAVLTLEFGPDTTGTGTTLYYAEPAGVHKLSYTGTANRAPTAAVTASPTVGGIPRDYTFDGSTSSDPDGGALSYTWTFGDGTAAVTTATPTTRHTYAQNGSYTATLKVTDSGGLSATATVPVQAGNTAPVPTIVSPAAGDLFSVNGTYTLKGTGTDAEDGTLGASSLSWTVLKHHDTHTHPVLGPVSAASTVSFVAPPPEDPSSTTSTYLEIRLTATDSRGLSTTVTREFRPRTVPVTVASVPSGLQITLNATPVKTPTTFTSWANWAVPLAAATQFDAAGRPYTFTRWSDGGAASHAYATPATAATVTATFTAAGPPAPTGVTARQTAATRATLAWTAPVVAAGETITGYRVARDGKDSTGFGAYSAVIGADRRSVDFNLLVPGSVYNLSVQAVTAAGSSAPRGGAVTIGRWAVPVAPTAVTAAATSSTSASISWSLPGDSGGRPVTGYRVSRDGTDSTGFGAFSTVIAADQRTFAFGRLVAGQTYRLTVAAVTAVGTSPAHGAQVRVGTGSGVPAPAKVSVVQSAATSETISWQPPTLPAGVTVTGYAVTRDGLGATGYGPYTATVGPTVRSHSVTNLVPGRTYTMTVRALTSSSFNATATGGVLIR